MSSLPGPAMKIEISLSSKLSLTSRSIYVLADGSASDKKPKNQPFADVSLLRWNEVTEYEKVLPTLNMLFLPSRLRGKGLGLPLLDTLLTWMAANGIKYLVFDNYANEFWLSAMRQRPKNVVLMGKYRGRYRFGVVRTSGAVNVSKIFHPI